MLLVPVGEATHIIASSWIISDTPLKDLTCGRIVDRVKRRLAKLGPVSHNRLTSIGDWASTSPLPSCIVHQHRRVASYNVVRVEAIRL